MAAAVALVEDVVVADDVVTVTYGTIFDTPVVAVDDAAPEGIDEFSEALAPGVVTEVEEAAEVDILFVLEGRPPNEETSAPVIVLMTPP